MSQPKLVSRYKAGLAGFCHFACTREIINVLFKQEEATHTLHWKDKDHGTDTANALAACIAILVNLYHH